MVTSSRPLGWPQKKGPMTKHQTAVSWHKQLMAANGPQVLPTSNVSGMDAAVFHVL